MAKKAIEKSVTEPVEVLPVLPLRDIVVFPHMIVPLFVGREKSIKALEEVMREEKCIVLVAQRNSEMMIRRRMPSMKWVRWPK